jgi:2-polyprenyl-3-methyl-5-hydroxy-6-metoxy-1,4-benzoquinol methylase
MSRLSEKEHWLGTHDRVARFFRPTATAVAHESFIKKSAKWLKRAVGQATVEKLAAYDEYLLWNVILPQHFNPAPGSKVLEVGSAPGVFLVEMHQKYGCVPYGVEYSEAGVELNKNVFRQNGLDPDNVIYSDFFSEDFLNRYRGQFDVVVSRGFIEHFTDVQRVVDRHIDLLRTGGYLIVSVPNLRGLNYFLARMLDSSAIPRHNISIMKKKAFTNLFEKPDLHPSFCAYYGTFSFYLFTSGSSALQSLMLKGGYQIQPILNLGFRTLFGDKGAEQGLTSPSLLYIGKKSG